MKWMPVLWLLCFTVLWSCRKTDTLKTAKTSLPGTWTLTETLADPGDGSGTWRSASNQLVLVFTPDGRIEGDAFPQAHRYDVLSDTGVRFTFADGTFINYVYIHSDSVLILSGGGCIEACGAKFIKNKNR